MKSKPYFLSVLCSLFIFSEMSGLEEKHFKVSKNREEDLKVIVGQTFLREDCFDQVAEMYMAQKNDQDSDRISLDDLRQEMQNSDALTHLMESYSAFSDKEIHELREMVESKTYLKYSEQSLSILISNILVMEEALNTMLGQGENVTELGFNKNFQELNTPYQSSEILQITKDNFAALVENSDKPVILKVYADWCRPCSLYAKTFEEAHEQYKETFRFGKINSDEEKKLLNELKVKSFPATVFIYKGKVISRELGNMSKNKLEGKIKDFLQNISE